MSVFYGLVHENGCSFVVLDKQRINHPSRGKNERRYHTGVAEDSRAGSFRKHDFSRDAAGKSIAQD